MPASLIRNRSRCHRDHGRLFVCGAICRLKPVTKVDRTIALHPLARACRRRPLQEEGSCNQGSGAFCMLSHHQGGADPISAKGPPIMREQLPYRSPESATMLATGSLFLRKLPSMGAPCEVYQYNALRLSTLTYNLKTAGPTATVVSSGEDLTDERQ